MLRILALILLLAAGRPAVAAPTVAPGVASDFDLTDISNGFTASMTQMAFGPDGRLYVATFRRDDAGRILASGVYFVTATVDAETRSVRVSLLK